MIDVERLRARLSEAGLTANAASEKAGLTRSYIRDVLRGRIKDPSAYRLTRLAEVLGTTPEYLCRRDTAALYPRSPADDRSPAQLDFSLAALKRSEATGVPTAIFDVMDAAEPEMLIEIAFRLSSSMLLSLIEKGAALSAQEAKLIAGGPRDFDLETYSRRAILVEALKLVTQDVSAAIDVTKTLKGRLNASAPGRLDFSTEYLQEAFGSVRNLFPDMDLVEAMRALMMGLVATLMVATGQGGITAVPPQERGTKTP